VPGAVWRLRSLEVACVCSQVKVDAPEPHRPRDDVMSKWMACYCASQRGLVWVTGNVEYPQRDKQVSVIWNSVQQVFTVITSAVLQPVQITQSNG